MNGIGTVVFKESAHQRRSVAWLRIGGVFQIRTRGESFARAKILSRENGEVKIEFFGAPTAKYLRQPTTPLLKALRPVRQTKNLPIIQILSAREVVG